MPGRRSRSAPSVVVFGGPNGAGKTTASAMLERVFGIKIFVNADVIARGLAGADPERAALRAGREMLVQLRALARQRASFAFESTLSSRTFAPWLRELADSGYEVHFVYVWLSSAELSVQRVNYRAAHGGHSVPADTVRRRYARSCANFVRLYLPVATSWLVSDNSGTRPVVVGYQTATGTRVIVSPEAWSSIHEIAASQENDADDVG
jgi:predicted ABC-type ATPase